MSERGSGKNKNDILFFCIWRKRCGKLTVSGELLHYYYTFIFYLLFSRCCCWSSSSERKTTHEHTPLWHTHTDTFSFAHTTWESTWLTLMICDFFDINFLHTALCGQAPGKLVDCYFCSIWYTSRRKEPLGNALLHTHTPLVGPLVAEQWEKLRGPFWSSGSSQRGQGRGENT